MFPQLHIPATAFWPSWYYRVTTAVCSSVSISFLRNVFRDLTIVRHEQVPYFASVAHTVRPYALAWYVDPRAHVCRH
jgi:hypothetical protein